MPPLRCAAGATCPDRGLGVGVVREVRVAAPEWLAQQRYAGDTLVSVIRWRRSLTGGMRELAEFLRRFLRSPA